MAAFDMEFDDYELETAGNAALAHKAAKLDGLRVRPPRTASLYVEYSDSESGIPCLSSLLVFPPLPLVNIKA